MGLLECARRLQLALNTVERHARAGQPEGMLRVPNYRASLVDPYREHLCKRRAEDPAVPDLHHFEEIKSLGSTPCLNLPHKDIDQGRADADRSHTSARRLARILLTRPDNLKAERQRLLGPPHRGRDRDGRGVAMPEPGLGQDGLARAAASLSVLGLQFMRQVAESWEPGRCAGSRSPWWRR